MEKQVVIITLVNGVELLAALIEDNGHEVTFENPVVPFQQDASRAGFQTWCPYAKSRTFTYTKAHVLSVDLAVDEFVEAHNKMHNTSKIVTPSKKIITG